MDDYNENRIETIEESLERAAEVLTSEQMLMAVLKSISKGQEHQIKFSIKAKPGEGDALTVLTSASRWPATTVFVHHGLSPHE